MAQDTEQADWIEWQGGECPVSHDTIVDIKFRGTEPAWAVPAGNCDDRLYSWWKHRSLNHIHDIIAYRLVSA